MKTTILRTTRNGKESSKTMMRKLLNNLFTFSKMRFKMSLMLILGLMIYDVDCQIIGNDAFLQGSFIEVGLNRGGTFVSSSGAPLGYHPNFSGNRLGVVIDTDEDGWTIGTPAYCGDFVVPGSPLENLSLHVDGTSYYNWVFNFDFPGTFSNYTGTSVDWVSDLPVGGLEVKQVISIDDATQSVLFDFVITNVTAATINDIYISKNVDPDNEAPIGGSTTTVNEVISQAGDGDDSVVKACGLSFGCDFAIASTAPNSIASHGGFSNYNAKTNYDNAQAGTFVSTVGVQTTADRAIQLSFYFASLDPGESIEISTSAASSPSNAVGALGCSLDITCPTSPINLSCIGDLPTAPSSEAEFEALVGAAINNNCNALTVSTVTNSDDMATGCMGSPRTIVRTITITDPVTSETETCTVTYVIEDDNMAPMIPIPTPAQATVNLACEDELPEAEATIGDFITAFGAVTDNCTDNADLDFVSVDVTPADFNLCSVNDARRTITRTYTITNFCGHESTFVQDFVFAQDVNGPTWDIAAGSLDRTVSCAGDVLPLVEPTATDACGTAVVSTISDVITPDPLTCPNQYVRTITYRAKDECDISSSDFVVTITVNDTDGPDISTVASDMTVECGALVPDGMGGMLNNIDQFNAWLDSNGGAIATDECGGGITWSNDFTLFIASCSNQRFAEVTFTATDACGNSSSTMARFTVEDTAGPVFDTAPADATAECDDPTAMDQYNAWLTSFAGAAATDQCGGVVTFSHNASGLVAGCGATMSETVTFTATDECGITSMMDATFTIDDTTDPTWTSEPMDMTVECDGTADPGGAFATWLNSFVGTDNCGTATVTNNSTGLSDDCGATGSETVTFTLTDECGRSITKDATFTIVDMTDPTWDAEPVDMTVECDGMADPMGAFAAWLTSFSGSDVCGTATVTNNSSGLSDACGATGSETVTFTLTDECGRSITKDATFTIVDMTDPTWTSEPMDMTVECDGSGNATAFVAWLTSFSGSDVCGSATVTNNSTGLSDDCGATGSETVTFTLTDECGRSITKDATFTIVDMTDPTWTSEPMDMTVECDGMADPMGAFAAWLTSFSGSDVCGSATVTNNSSGLSDACGATGSETVTFTLTDECGRSITKDATFTIVDMTDPTWTSEPMDMTVECDGSGNATAFVAWLTSFSGSDVCGSATVTNNSTGLSDDCGATGSETVTFTLTDECGRSITKDATFTIVDMTDPTWDAEPVDMTVECDGMADPMGAFAAWLTSFSGSDVCGSATVTNNSSGLSDACGATGSETVTFTLTDGCGRSITKDATFTIVDMTDPTWTLEPMDMTVECDGSGNAAAFAAWLTSFSGSDVCGSATVTNNSTGLSNDCGATGSETVTFTLTDECGRSIAKDATFTIVDMTDPIWDAEPMDMTVECDGMADPMGAFAAWLTSFSGSDVCSGTATVTNNSSGLSDDCGATGSETVTFTLTDECGRSITKDATFTIVDMTDPTWTSEPMDMTVECDGMADPMGAFAAWLTSFSGSDVCGSATVTNNSSGLSDACGATGSETVTFTLTDECGRSITKDATFTIVDMTDPTWDAEPMDMTVECDGSGNAAAFAAWLTSFSGSDVCSGTATVTNNSSGLSDDCGATGSETVTFTLTDDCGRSITKDATFTIVDMTDPTWDAEPMDMTVECDGSGNAAAFAAWLTSFSGSDVCTGTATVTNNSSGLSDDCGATGSETVTFTLTDDCGRSITKDATFTINDSQGPTFTTLPMDRTVECDQVGNVVDEFDNWKNIELAGLVAEDLCGGSNVTITSRLGMFMGGCGMTYTQEIIFTATDECGNFSEASADFIVVDTQGPDIETDASDATYSCSDGLDHAALFAAWLANQGGAMAEDMCNINDFTWSNNSTGLVQDPNCPGQRSETVTFTATDPCGNTSTTTATFLVEDTEDPTVDTDAMDMWVSCETADIPGAFATWLANNGGAVASDNCTMAASLIWTYPMATTLNTTCDMVNEVNALYPDAKTKTTEVTFTVNDGCGNTATTTANFIIYDDEAPMVTAPEMIVLCPSAETPEAVTTIDDFEDLDMTTAVADNCTSDADLMISHVDVSDNGSCPETITRTYTITDECGNSTSVDHIIIKNDTEDPTLSPPTEDMVAECEGRMDPKMHTDYLIWISNNGGITAEDNCSSSDPLTWTNNSDMVSFVGDKCDETNGLNITVTFTATDGCDNAVSETSTFRIIDTKGPEFVGTPSNIVLNCDAADNVAMFNAWLDGNAGVTADDACNSNPVTWSNDFTELSGECNGAVDTEVEFTATDACGNSNSFTATFMIVDNTAPVVDVTGLLDLEITCLQLDQIEDFITFNGGASANDNCSDVSWSNDYDGLDDACGTTTVNFTATDACGNSTTVSADIIISSIPLIADPLTDKEVSSCDFADQAALDWAFDGWVQSTLASINITGGCDPVDVQVIGNPTAPTLCSATDQVVTLTIRLTDPCGSIDLTADYTLVGNNAPVIATAASDLTVECDGAGNMDALSTWLAANGGAIGTDECGSVTWSNNFSALSDDCGATGTIDVTFTAIDKCGLTVTTSASFTIEDNIVPAIITVASDLTLECGDAGNAAAITSWLMANGGATAEDVCGSVTWSNDYDPLNLSDECGESGSILVTFTATDDCGNTSLTTATLSIVDTQDPELAGVPADMTVSCDAVPAPATPIATDDCDASVMIDFTEERTDGTCPNTYTLTRTWTATDDCGNTDVEVQVIKVEDVTGPIIDVVASNMTVECDGAGNAAELALWLSNNGGAAASDACGVVTWTNDYGSLSDDCAETGSVTVIFTATDDCNNSSTTSATFTIQDTEAPVWSTNGGALDRSLSCEDASGLAAAQALFPIALDGCDTDVTNIVKISGVFVAGTCGDAGSYTNTWTVMDDCTNTSAVYTQVITITDDIAPVLAGVPLSTTVSCDVVPAVASPSASDNCDTDVTIAFEEVRTDGSCPGNYTLTRTWTATDNCGNTDVQSQIITVQDVTAPELLGVPANATVSCESIPVAAEPTATDNCDVDVTIDFTESMTPGSCDNAYTIKRTWIATDNCGNTDVQHQVITVIDETAPELVGVPADETVSCDAVPAPAAPTATDNCDADVAITYAEVRTDGACPNTYTLTRTWTATDDCGNTDVEVQVIEVEDVTGPTIDVVASNMTVECDGAGNAAELALWLSNNGGAAASDACGVVTWTNDYGSLSDDCAETGSVTVIFTATDDCNISSTTSATFTIQDTEAPVWSTDLGALDRSLSCEDAAGLTAAQALFPIALDGCDSDVTNIVKISGAFIAGTCGDAGSYTNTWTVMDDCTNTSAVYTQVITITDDIAPVLAGVPLSTTVSCDVVPAVASPSASDNCDTDVTIAFEEVRTDGSCPGNYTLTRTWTATDNCGNTDVQSQIITVQDVTAPELLGVPANATVSCESIPVAAEPTATDNCDVDVTIDFTESMTPGSCDNAYTIKRTWIATDNCGNTDVQHQVITVIDETAPELVGVPADETVSCDAVPAPAAPTATDNCDADVAITYAEVRTDGACPNTYSLTRTWTATDDCGNTDVEVQVIEVEDVTGPIIDVVASNMTVECDGAGNAAELALWLANNGGAMASDGCGVVTWTNDYVALSYDCAETGSVTVIFTATDDCNNSSTTSATFTIQDTEAPVWSTNAGALDRSLSCEDASGLTAAQALFPIALDGCDADVTNIVKISGAFIAGTCGDAGSYTNTWTVMDDCTNTSAVYTQVITITDDIAPVLVGVPLSTTVSCDAVPSPAMPTASDNCDTDVTIAFEEVRTDGSCPGNYTLTRTWTATDNCGNTDVQSQIITVQDVTAPELLGVPANATVSCESIPVAAEPTATDNCDVDVTIDFTESMTPGSCDNAYTIKRTWIATDNCGNTDVQHQVITVIDETAPELVGVPADETVSCDAVPAPAAPTATDNCDADVAITYAEVRTDGACPNTYTLTRTWTATDDCGNTDVEVQVIEVEDVTGPTIDVVASNMTVECDGAGNAAELALWLSNNGGAAASDACGAVTWTNDYGSLSDDCAETGSVTVIFTATDDCNNSSTTSAIFTIQDETPPAIVAEATELVLECGDPQNADLIDEWLESNGGAVAQDQCGEVDWSNNYNTCEEELLNNGSFETGTFDSWVIEDVLNPFIPHTVECDPFAGGFGFNEISPLEGSCMALNGFDGSPGQIRLHQDVSIPSGTSLTFSWSENIAYDLFNFGATLDRMFEVQIQPIGGGPVIETLYSFTAPAGVFEAGTGWISHSQDLSAYAGDDIRICFVETIPEFFTGPAQIAIDGVSLEVTNCFTETSCGDTGIKEVIFTATDECGMSSFSRSQIVIEDTSAPELIGVPADMTISCTDVVPIVDVDVTATDNCDENVIITTSQQEIPGTCLDSYTLKRTWTAIDACGNSVSQSQIVTVQDTKKPEISGVPTNVAVSCDAIPEASAADVSVTDDCDVDVTVNLTEVVTPGNCANSYVLTRTWSATDNCGNTSTVEQIVTVGDNQAPIYEGPVQEDLELTCADAVPAPVALTAADNCDGDITVMPWDETMVSTCANSFTIKRTWKFEDACGNASIVEQMITVNDDIAPQAPAAPANLVVSCADAVLDPVDLTATDNCDGDITVSPVDAFIPGECANSYKINRTWTFEDGCGNSASISQMITIMDDESPVLPTAPAPLIIACSEDIPEAMSMTAVDNCQGDITVDPVDAITPGVCINSYTINRTWTFEDACGNASSISQLIIINDDIAPVAPAIDEELMVSCGSMVPAPMALTATDNCDGDITVMPWDETTIGECANDYVIKRTWKFEDACGNVSILIQTITVKDEEAPVVPTDAPASISVSCASEVPAPVDVTAMDNCNGAIAASPWEEVTAGECANDFVITRMWKFEDNCGNESTHTQVITVKDETAPTLPAAPADVEIACDEAIPAAVDLTAIDNCGESITVSPVDVTTPGDCPSEYTVTRTWTFTDECGNTSFISQTIKTVDDEVPTAEAISPITVKCIDEVPVADVSIVVAKDNCGTPVVGHVGDVSDGNTCPETITRTYSVTDACGNSIDVTQSIIVNDDEVPTAEAISPITVKCIDEVPVADVSIVVAKDNCGTPVVAHVGDVSDGSTCPETITRTYSVTDACGNSIDVMQTIIVNDDEVPTAEAISPITVKCIDEVPVADVSIVVAKDNCGTPVVAHVGDVSDGNTCPETITRTYSVTDACGNSIDVTQTIIVNDDEVPTAEAISPITVKCIDEVPVADVSIVVAKDNCGTPVVAHVGDVSDGNTCPETVTRTYSVTDACGNSINVTQTIFVNDDIAPEIGSCSDITVKLGADGTYTITEDDLLDIVSDLSDNCTALDDLRITAPELTLDCSDIQEGMEIELEVTVTDLCGNTATCKAAIFIDSEIVNPVAMITGAETLTCTTTAVTLSAATSTVVGTPAYEWSLDGTPIANADGVELIVSAPGTYSVKVTDTDNVCAVPSTTSVEVGINTEAPMFMMTADQPACGETTGTVNVTVTKPTSGYEVYYRLAGTTDDFLLSPSDMITLTPGTYQISVRNTANGCDTRDNITIDNPPATDCGQFFWNGQHGNNGGNE